MSKKNINNDDVLDDKDILETQWAFNESIAKLIEDVVNKLKDSE